MKSVCTYGIQNVFKTPNGATGASGQLAKRQNAKQEFICRISVRRQRAASTADKTGAYLCFVQVSSTVKKEQRTPFHGVTPRKEAAAYPNVRGCRLPAHSQTPDVFSSPFHLPRTAEHQHWHGRRQSLRLTA